MANRVLVYAALLAFGMGVAACQNPVQPVQAKVVTKVAKKQAACCTGKTPPRFGLKAPIASRKGELDSIAKSAKN